MSFSYSFLITAMLVTFATQAASQAPEVPERAEVVVQPPPLPPAEARDRTYFVVINGADPLFIGKLNRFCDAIRCAGYKNVELYMLRQTCAAERRICCIRQNDPGAKIVLIGYSVGCQAASKVCHAVNCCGERVDLLVYIGGDYLRDNARANPANADRILNINGHGFIATGGDLFFNGTELSGAANYRVNAPHLGLPKRPETLGLVLDGVAEIHAAKAAPAK